MNTILGSEAGGGGGAAAGAMRMERGGGGGCTDDNVDALSGSEAETTSLLPSPMQQQSSHASRYHTIEHKRR